MASWIKRTSKKGLGTTRTSTSHNLSTGKTVRSHSTKTSATTRVTKTQLGDGRYKVTTTQQRGGYSQRTSKTFNTKPKIQALPKQKSFVNKSPKVCRPKTIKYKKSKPMKFSTIAWIILGLLVLSILFK